MLLYVTRDAEAAIGAAGLWDGLEKLRADAAADCLAARLDEIGGAKGFFKRNYRKYRELYRLLEDVGGQPVLVLLDVLSQGDPDYRSILYDKDSQAFARLKGQIPDTAELEDWVAEQLPTVEPLPEAPESVYTLWLSVPLRPDKGRRDFWVYDSRLAVVDCAAPAFEKYAQTVADLILTELLDPQGVPVEGCGTVCFARAGECGVLYATSDTGDVLLMRAFVEQIPTTPELVQVVLKNWSPEFCERERTSEDLRREAWRAYPVSTLESPKSWGAVRENAEANLALSSEEEELINAASQVGPDGGMPLFIDGRAGSGKSTMLWHLYAKQCDDWLAACTEDDDGDQVGRPLYVTYSRVLLEGARRGVLGILTNRHEYLERPLRDEDKQLLGSTFQTMSDLLMSLIPAMDRVRFDAHKRVDYRRFTRMFHESFRSASHVGGLTSETAWHVVRTLIKGRYEDHDMTPEEYEEIPRDDRSVSGQDFRTVFERVWSGWYRVRCQEDGLWDDQDLARAALHWLAKAKLDPATLPAAVFCDEVQDLTRMELAFLMRGSIYPHYALRSYRVSSIPFVFAGDPSQTLNPSGFRWASLTSAFYSDLLFGLGIDGKHVPHRTEQSLSKNYRSGRPIVELSNSIQLVRASLFGPQTLRPQESWRVDDTNVVSPMKFILGAVVDHDEIATIADDTIIIVPCEEGGEYDWAVEDPALQKLVPEEGEPPRNVISASAAKGLEFEQVILYKFGAQFADLGLGFEPVADAAIHTDLRREYFFNKLYVAASRAKSVLYVVDSVDGDSALWRRIVDSGYLRQLAESSKAPDAWLGGDSEHSFTGLGQLDAASREDVGLLAGGEFAEENARQLFEKGKEQRDPVSLRRAWRYFHKLQLDEDAVLALAYAHYFGEQYEEAGRRFEQSTERRMALECYWEGGLWKQIDRWQGAYGTEAEDFKAVAARFMLASRSDLPALRAILEEVRTLLARGEAVSPLAVRWVEVVGRILIVSQKLDEPTLRELLVTVLESLGDRGFSGCLERAGELHFAESRFEQAIRCWRRAGATLTDDYHEAEARCARYPGALAHAEEINEQARRARVIVDIWQASRLPLGSTSTDWQSRLGRAYLDLGTPDKAIAPLRLSGDLDAAAKALWSAVKGGALKQDKAWDASLELAEAALRAKRWPLALDLVDGKTARSLRNRGDAQAVGKRFEIVRHIAWSDTDPAGTGIARKELMALLLEVQGEQGWEQAVGEKVMGLAYERVNDQESALKYYSGRLQRALQAADSERERWSRQRWLVIQSKKIARLAAKGTAAAGLNQERRAFDDYLKPSGLEASTIERLAAEDPRSAEILQERPHVSIERLGSGLRPEVKTDDAGNQQLRFGGFDIQIRPAERAVRLSDAVSHEDMTVNYGGGWMSGRLLDSGAFIRHDDGVAATTDRAVKISIVATNEVRIDTTTDGGLRLVVDEGSSSGRGAY